MEIKNEEKENIFIKIIKYISNFIRVRIIKIFLLSMLCLFIFIIGGFSGMFISGVFGTVDNPSQTTEYFINNFLGLENNQLIYLKTKIVNIKGENIKIPINYIKGKFSNPEKVFIDINFENMQKLNYKRNKALEKGLLFQKEDDWVKVKISSGGEEKSAKIRIKGDTIEHLEGDKWSFRIKMKNGDSLFGMNTFSIQKPSTRNYLNEWIFHKMLEREDVLSLRYDFIEVIINGESQGIYSLEEHFTKNLVENRDRREGVILKFNENNFWEEVSEGDSNKINKNDLFFESSIDVFKQNSVMNNQIKKAQFEKAKTLLEKFKNGDLETHQVFDEDKLAKYFALVSLTGSEHASGWINIRFYYNPITSELEPIGYDGNSGNEIYEINNYFPNCIKINKECPKINDYYELFFSDSIFFEKYMGELEKITDNEYLDSFFKTYEEEIDNKINIIHKDEPSYHFSKQIFYNNQQKIKNILEPNLKIMNAHFQNYDKNSGVIELYIINNNPVPIEIIGLTYNNESFSKVIGEKQIIFEGNREGDINYEPYNFTIPENFVFNKTNISRLKINYKFYGLNKIKEEEISPWIYIQSDFSDDDLFRQNYSLNKDFWFVDDKNKIIRFKKGDWKIKEVIFIPEDFTLQIYEGTTIDLIENSIIISYSNLQIQGSDNNPVKIYSSDGTGQGLLLINSDESFIENIIFEGLTNGKRKSWELTGAITIYESKITLNKVKFLKINSEDALNIVRSSFNISETIFKESLSDCLDIDFGKGVIENSSFEMCGNDGVDLSGGQIILSDLKINNHGDKGISIGERSEINGNNINISGGYICISSKDISKVKISSLFISNCEYGMTVYQKKPEFGPSSLDLKDIQISNVKTKFLVEKESDLKIDGKSITDIKKKVYERLYPDEN